MLKRPRIPKRISEFFHKGWTNVFQLIPTNQHLYGTETLFGDWDAPLLLLAKDGAPTHVIRALRDRGESRPWRHAQHELGDPGGWRTNERLCRLVSLIPEMKLLYGSATANMLYDDPEWSRSLPGFYSGQLHEYLKNVLSWVLESMPRVQWVACLGQEAWFLTCMTIGNPSSANRFREYRDGHKPVTGVIGQKKIVAFPLYHPAARVSDDVMESGWHHLSEVISAPSNKWE